MSRNRGATHFTLGLRPCIISSFLLQIHLRPPSQNYQVAPPYMPKTYFHLQMSMVFILNDLNNWSVIDIMENYKVYYYIDQFWQDEVNTSTGPSAYLKGVSSSNTIPLVTKIDRWIDRYINRYLNRKIYWLIHFRKINGKPSAIQWGHRQNTGNFLYILHIMKWKSSF